MPGRNRNEHGEYGRLPDSVFETYNGNKYPITYRATNALVFPLRLINDDEVISGDDLATPVEDRPEIKG